MELSKLIEKWRAAGHTISTAADWPALAAQCLLHADELEAALAAQPASPKDDLLDLRDMPDSEIDTSDIPEVKDWSNAERGKFYRASPVAVNAPPKGMTQRDWWTEVGQFLDEDKRPKDMSREEFWVEAAWQACSRTHIAQLKEDILAMSKAEEKILVLEAGLADQEKAIEAAALERAAAELCRLQLLS